MGCKWFLVLLVIMLVSLEGWWSEGERCWDEERSALLKLKPFFNSNNYLFDWVENSECCEWHGVECDNIIGKIITIDLANARDDELGYLNASLFLPFQHLHSLDLSANNIADWIENEGFEKLSRLNNLELLYLGWNKFNNSILSSSVDLSSLKYLDLHNNGFKGSITIEGFSDLEFMDLSGNNLNNTILSSLGGLSSLKILYLRDIGLNGSVDVEGLYFLENLKELDMGYNKIDKFVNSKGFSDLEVMDLSGNNFNNTILSSLGGLSSLKSLYLRDIRLNGNADVEGLYFLENLEELDMSYNKIDKFVNSKDYRGFKKLNTLFLGGIRTTNASAFLQSTIRLFPSLNKLDLSYNDFNGILITQEFHNLTTLEELILGGSKLHISFLQTVATCTSLKHFSMSYCEVNDISQVQGPTNFKNLESLFMDGITFNNSFRQIIRPIATLKKLSLLNCGLNGTLYDQGLCEMVHLEELYVGHNALRDTLPPCLANLTSLQSLDISSNQIIGILSSSPLKDLTSLRVFVISNNLLQIPISLTPLYNLSKLKEFYSENNQIYMETMPPSLTPKFQLNSITLSGYGYGATFPRFLYHQYDLQNVKLSHIILNEEFPNWLIENNTKLETLYLSNNSLFGPFLLPIHPHMNVRILDISINSLSGQIPIEVGAFFPMLMELNISKNALNGRIPSSFGNMSSLRSLDLSNNQLSGEIPEQLAIGCLVLEYLRLSNNSLEGPVFSKIVNLTNLILLYLDTNNFIGNIL